MKKEFNMNMQEEFEKLVASGELPIESINPRNQAINRIQEINASAWTFGFTNCLRVQAEEIFISLIKLDEDFLSNLGIYVAAFKIASETIDKHLGVLLIKKDRLIRTDEFGETITSGWNSYIDNYYKTKIEPIINAIIERMSDEDFNAFETTRMNFSFWSAVNKDKIMQALYKNMNVYIELNRDEYQGAALDLTGIEYENKIASMINKETSWTAELTKASGDQGADLLLSKGPIQIVIQTKYHKSPISNSAVQEAYAAQRFYKADFSFVVSNSGFTKSAEELSQSTGVKLMTDFQLLDFLK